MTRLGMDLDIPDEGAGPKDLKEALSRAIDRFIQVLVHAAQCRDRICKSPSCAKMKRIMHHIQRCKQCTVCKQFLALCLQHAKTCKSTNCPVPLCANLKKHLLDKQRRASIQESRFAARRLHAMRLAMPTTSSTLGGSSSSNGEAPVQSPAPNTPIRQQPSTPTPKTQPLSVGPQSVGTSQVREHIMTIRKNPQHALETLAQHSYPHGQPNPTPMEGGMGESVHPQQHQQRYQSVAPGGPPMGAGYQQQQQQLYPPNAMPPQQPQAAHHHGEPTLNPGYQGQF